MFLESEEIPAFAKCWLPVLRNGPGMVIKNRNEAIDGIVRPGKSWIISYYPYLLGSGMSFRTHVSFPCCGENITGWHMFWRNSKLHVQQVFNLKVVLNGNHSAALIFATSIASLRQIIMTSDLISEVIFLKMYPPIVPGPDLNAGLLSLFYS